MTSFHLVIRCKTCGGKAVGTLIGGGVDDGTYCSVCGRRKLEAKIAEEEAREAAHDTSQFGVGA